MLRTAVRSYLLVMVIAVVTAAAGQGVARADGPLLHSGDLVVAMEYRDPVTYEYSLRLEVRTAGAPAQVGASVALGGGYPAALASDAAGNVYVYLYEDTAGPSVVKYNRSLEPLGTVGTASHGRAAEGMAVADNGDVFVAAYSDGTSGSGGIYEFSANGQIHGQIIPMQIGAEGVNLGPDQCTLTYYDLDDNNGYGRLRRYDACTHQALPDPVAPLPGNIGGSPYSVYSWVQPLSNGDTLRCIDRSDVAYVNTQGQVVRTYDIPATILTGCDWLAMYGSTFWVSAGGTLDRFAIGSPQALQRIVLQTESGYPRILGITAIRIDPTPIIFVHGFNKSFTDTGLFNSLLSQIGEAPSSSVVAKLTRFEYYQDAGQQINGSCSPNAVARPDVVGQMATRVDSEHTYAACDSESDVALNAALLELEVERRYEESGGQTVVIIAHSMGATITRGFIAYSNQKNDGVASSMLDSAIFLEGAHDGSFALQAGVLAAAVAGHLPYIGDAFSSQLAEWLTFDSRRPATHQLQPQSTWYAYANDNVRAGLPGTYYNVYGDIRLAVGGCWIVCLNVPILPVQVGLGVQVNLGSLGDGFLQPGSDNPEDLPRAGGARFKPQRNGRDAQWALSATLRWRPTGLEALDFALLATGVANSYNIGHIQFQTHDLRDFQVTDCKTHQSTSLQSQLVRILQGKTGQSDYECAAS